MSVATFLLSTSNRNLCNEIIGNNKLLHFFFLHQTATEEECTDGGRSCYISSFYIKPQPTHAVEYIVTRCYISSFYIKPQLLGLQPVRPCVATFLLSTSNRNLFQVDSLTYLLLHFFFLHQTATRKRNDRYRRCCYISSFYIKPQRERCQYFYPRCCYISSFYIKPQQQRLTAVIGVGCYISSFYIKPQLLQM